MWYYIRSSGGKTAGNESLHGTELLLAEPAKKNWLKWMMLIRDQNNVKNNIGKIWDNNCFIFPFNRIDSDDPLSIQRIRWAKVVG